jgi:hypothetical protein
MFEDQKNIIVLAPTYCLNDNRNPNILKYLRIERSANIEKQWIFLPLILYRAMFGAEKGITLLLLCIMFVAVKGDLNIDSKHTCDR